MIRHIVIFQFDKTKTTEAVLEAIKIELEALVDSIPELLKMEVGLNTNPTEKQDLALTADVKDMTDLDTYAKHPKHLKVAAKIRAIATGRSCVDYYI